MAEGDVAFSGSIPGMYDRFLGPLLFEPFAREVADRVRPLEVGHILETAAGTGIVTQALHLAQPDAHIIATDLNAGMLEVAAQRVRTDIVTFEEADAQDLRFADESFDLVVCQFGVMFFPDRVQGHAEARRVLVPGGRLFFNVWDRIEDSEFTDVVVQAMAELFPNDPPRFMARTPHGYCDRDLIRSDLEHAGFADITINAVDHVSRAPSPRQPAIAICQGTPMRSEIEARGAPGLEDATDKAEEALRRRFGSGAIQGRIRALVVSARNPSR